MDRLLALTGLASLVAHLLVGCGSSNASFDPVADDAEADAGSLDDALTDGPDDASVVAPHDDADLADATPAPDYTTKGPFAVVSGAVNVSGRPARIHAPNAATPPGGWPAVVFAHGFNLKTTDYDDLLEHVASWGWIALSVDYPGSVVDVDHRNVRQAIVDGGKALVAHTIPGVPTVAPAKVAAAGHSLGGKAAIMAVLAEDGFAAALALDPVDGNPNPIGGIPSEKMPQLVPTETAKLAVPVAYFGATQSRCVKPPTFPGSPSQACAPETLDAAKFFDGTPGSIPRYLWTLFDFGHMQFLDNPACGATCDACVAGKSDTLPRRRATKALTVAFLKRHVENDPSAEPWLSGEKRDELVAAKVLWNGTSERPPCP